MLISKKTILTFLFLYCSILLFSQLPGTSPEIKKGEVYTYAHKIVDTLASGSMHGRGYVNDGDKIAANYIRTEFQKFGLKSFAADYYQKFNFPVNTFPGKMSVKIDGKELIPGKDYIIGPHSRSIDTTCSIVNFDNFYNGNKKTKRKFLKHHLDHVMIVNDTNYSELTYGASKNSYIESKGIVDLKKKLTWEVSQKNSSFFSIQVLPTSTALSAKKISLTIESKFIPNYPSQNVISYIEGSEHPDSFIVFSAHYDHLGQMGKDTYFPGANDNASGCAMLLNLARYYSRPENKPKCSIAFIAFGGEEVGLLGSKYYTEHPLFPLKSIRFLLNMDIMGTGEEGITVVNGTLFKPEFEKLKQINTESNFIKDVKIRGKAANSDHYFFSENGVRAFFIYTMGGIKAYHDIYDRAETLPLNEFEDLFKMIIKFEHYLDNE